LQGYTRYTYEKNDLNGILEVFLVFSLITKVTKFVTNTNIYWISEMLLFYMYFTKMTNQHSKKRGYMTSIGVIYPQDCVKKNAKGKGLNI